MSPDTPADEDSRDTVIGGWSPITSRSPGGPRLGSYESRRAALHPRKRRRPLRFALPVLLLTAAGFAAVRLLGLHPGTLFADLEGQRTRPPSPASPSPGRAAVPPAAAGSAVLARFPGYPGQGSRDGGAIAVNAVGAAGGQTIAVGSADGYPAIWHRGAGASWSLTNASGNGVLTGRPGDQALTAVTDGPAGWLAVGNAVSGSLGRPVVVTSADGQTWQAADGAPAFQGPGLYTSGAAAGRLDYVIVGERVTGNSVTAATWWSAGLGDWNTGTAGGAGAARPSGMFAVTVAPGQFVAVGQDGSQPAVWTSGTGQSWAATDLPRPAGAAKAELREVAGRGEHLVATGIATTAGGTEAFTAVSADGGTTWREAALPSGGAAVSAVTAVAVSPAGFVATGQAGPAGDPVAVVWRSADGTTWTPAAMVPGPPGSKVRAITSLAANGGTVSGIGLATGKPGASPVDYTLP